MSNSVSIWDKWRQGIAYEVAFWNNVYSWNHTFEGTMNWSAYNSTITLEHFDANHFLRHLQHPKVLDVGCGMSYATGNFLTDGKEAKPLDIHYVDPLAPYFNQILKRHHRDVPQIEFGMMEYLSDFFPHHDVSLVIIQNALDHSAHPMQGILESVNTLHPGGILYLNHHPNEAEMEHYKGFHQYNITQADGQLIIWNKEQSWNVNDLVKDFADISVSVCDNGHIVSIIRKNGEVPATLLSRQKDKDLRAMALTPQGLSNLQWSEFLAYRLSYWKYNTIQFFVQALPWTVKMKLKKLIGQA